MACSIVDLLVLRAWRLTRLRFCARFTAAFRALTFPRAAVDRQLTREQIAEI